MFYFAEIGVVPVVITAVIMFIINMVWYAPGVFGKRWMALVGMTPEKMTAIKEKGMGGTMILGFVAAVVYVFAIAMLVNLAGADTAPTGLAVGFVVWLGFIAPNALADVLWEKRPFELYVLNMGAMLVTTLVAGAVLALWMA